MTPRAIEGETSIDIGPVMIQFEKTSIIASSEGDVQVLKDVVDTAREHEKNNVLIFVRREGESPYNLQIDGQLVDIVAVPADKSLTIHS